MANNTQLNTMTGGDTIADEDISGVKYQLIKLIDPTVGSTTPIGTPQKPLTVSGTVQTTTVSGGAHTLIDNFPTNQTVNVQNITSVSGLQNVHVDNFPTTQNVNVQNITSVSGLLNAHIDNFPTTQNVNVQNITSVSGLQNVHIDNLPTVQTIIDQTTTVSGFRRTMIDNFPSVQTVITNPGQTTAISGTTTTLSGSKTDVQNFPTVQTVAVQNLPNLTSVSGTNLHNYVDNFPTVQTVNVQNVTSVSGMQNTHVDNFPTVQTVNVLNGPLVTAVSGTVGLAPNGNTTAVSGTITTISGSKTDIQNFPTIQTVSVQNLPNLTSVSGTNLHNYIDNFPTVQTVNVMNLPALTTVSGSKTDVQNFPTIQTIAGLIRLTDGIQVIGVNGAPVTVSGLMSVNVIPTPTGGTVPYKLISAATTNATSVKASAGKLFGIQVFNTNAAARYLKLYDKASAPTVGTDIPVKVILVPGGSAGAGAAPSLGDGVTFSNGIAFALTTGMADADAGAVGATEVLVNLDYK